MKKIIYLYGKNGLLDFSSRNIEGYEVHQTDLFRKDMPLLVMKIFRRLGYIFSYFTYEKWKYNKNKYDYAIIPDGLMTKSVLKYLSKHPIAKKQIVYYWNVIQKKDEHMLKYAQKKGFILMTYSLTDSKKYNILYNSQCWDKKYIDNCNVEMKIENDVYFLGYVKDRYSILCNLKENLENKGISTKFYMVSKNGEAGTTSKTLKYENYIIECIKSKALLDIVSNVNWGLTLRPLEALFMRKKLITNYTSIKDYDFYAVYKKNIFIIGEDNMDNIKDFLETPFIEPTEQFDLNTYDIESWIKRFCI